MNQNRFSRHTRRMFLARCSGMGLAALSAARARGEEAPALRCAPLITGALRWLSAEYAAPDYLETWKRELDDEQALGFDLMWLVNTQSLLDSNEHKMRLRALLDRCAERKFRVLIDTGATGRWFIEPDVSREMEHVSAQIQQLTDLLAKHQAFYGWYVPHEIYVAWDDFGKFIDAFYPSVVETCKKATPGKLVTLSPFFILDKTGVFGDFRYAEPKEYEAYWTGLIHRSGFDVIMMQDSGEHFSYVTNEQRRPFFEAMRSACDASGAAFWGNVECAEFECPSIEEYEKRYGRVHHATVKDAPWRPVPIDRLESKLRLAAAYTERIVTWGYVEFCRPHLNERAAAWYETYKAYVQRVRAKKVETT